jgi:AcrR family transcriptional regulator
LYDEIGHGKTTVTDIARETAMSPANVYRFFSSRSAIQNGVVAELFESGRIAESRVACSSGSAAQRLGALLRTISNLHRDRLANHRHLHELMAAAAMDRNLTKIKAEPNS